MGSACATSEFNMNRNKLDECTILVRENEKGYMKLYRLKILRDVKIRLKVERKMVF